MDATELLHESFMRLSSTEGPAFESRQHFLAYASRVMRNVLVDLVRERQADRRGGSAEHTALGTHHGDLPDERHDLELLALDEAMESLRATDERLTQVVDLREAGANRPFLLTQQARALARLDQPDKAREQLARLPGDWRHPDRQALRSELGLPLR